MSTVTQVSVIEFTPLVDYIEVSMLLRSVYEANIS